MANIYTQPQIDTHIAAVTLAMSLKNALDNPKALSEAARELAEANAISDKKRLEAEIANKAIVDAKTQLNALEEATGKHAEYVKSTSLDLVKQKAEIDAGYTELNDAKNMFQLSLVKRNTIMLDKEALLAAKIEASNSRDKSLDAKEAEYKNRVKSLDELEKTLKIREDKLSASENSFAIRKKKFEQAIKGD